MLRHRSFVRVGLVALVGSPIVIAAEHVSFALPEGGSSAAPSADRAATAPTPSLPDSSPKAASVPTRPSDDPSPKTTTAPELDLLTFYRENYFLTGFTAATQVKFQFSAKFDLWPNAGHHAVHVGFTEKSLWDVYKESSPFRENNYNPDVFYTYFHHPNRYQPPIGCAFFHERLGAEHESNGEGGQRSRSWNHIYVESRFSCYGFAKNYAIAALKVWGPPIGVSENPDIAHYLGYGELTLSYGIEDSRRVYGDADLTVRLRKGSSVDLGHGSVQVDGRWRPRFILASKFTPYLYGQMFLGFGESLLTYDQPTTSFRIGLGFSDRSARRD